MPVWQCNTGMIIEHVLELTLLIMCITGTVMLEIEALWSLQEMVIIFIYHWKITFPRQKGHVKRNLHIEQNCIFKQQLGYSCLQKHVTLLNALLVASHFPFSSPDLKQMPLTSALWNSLPVFTQLNLRAVWHEAVPWLDASVSTLISDNK